MKTLASWAPAPRLKQTRPNDNATRVLGLRAPMMEATAVLASAVAGEDYLATGWTLSRLGIDGFDVATLHRFLQEGTG
jgi:hypothetical protein